VRKVIGGWLSGSAIGQPTYVIDQQSDGGIY